MHSHSFEVRKLQFCMNVCVYTGKETDYVALGDIGLQAHWKPPSPVVGHFVGQPVHPFFNVHADSTQIMQHGSITNKMLAILESSIMQAVFH